MAGVGIKKTTLLVYAFYGRQNCVTGCVILDVYPAGGDQSVHTKPWPLVNTTRLKDSIGFQASIPV